MNRAIILISRRTGAFLFDILIIFGVCGPAGYLVQRLIGYAPQTGPAIWLATVWSFSLPTWIYFLCSDRSKKGKTPGKRVFKLRVVGRTTDRLGWGRAMARTAIKLLPWEIIHISAFALSKDLGTFTLWQHIGLAAGNTLAFVYFIASALTQGKHSIHDFLAGTEIRFERI